jgi:hypothetical protein
LIMTQKVLILHSEYQWLALLHSGYQWQALLHSDMGGLPEAQSPEPCSAKTCRQSRPEPVKAINYGRGKLHRVLRTSGSATLWTLRGHASEALTARQLYPPLTAIFPPKNVDQGTRTLISTSERGRVTPEMYTCHHLIGGYECIRHVYPCISLYKPPIITEKEVGLWS